MAAGMQVGPLHELCLAWVQVKAQEMQASCPLPFDEGQLWRGDDADELRTQLQGSFRNITAVMDCVGCEKCKLWGKLQLLGEVEAQDSVLHHHMLARLDDARCCCAKALAGDLDPSAVQALRPR